MSVWRGAIKSSSFAAMNNAGMKAFVTFFNGSIYYISNWFCILIRNTFYFIVLDKRLNAIPENAESPVTYFCASYLQSTSKLENGESSTKQPI